MKLIKKNRSFKVGKNIKLKCVGDIFLKNNELITLKYKKKEFDITRKNWGYYATPSIDKRLKNYGYSTAIIKNKISRNIFIVLVDKNKKKIFSKYIKSENIKVIKWLHE